MSPFRIVSVFRAVDEAHVAVVGRVDATAAQQAARIVETLVEVGARQVFVDLAQAEDCDPGLFASLDRLRARLVRQGGWMIVDARPSSDAGQSGLDEIFAIFRRVTAGDDAAVAPRTGRLADLLPREASGNGRTRSWRLTPDGRWAPAAPGAAPPADRRGSAVGHHEDLVDKLFAVTLELQGTAARFITDPAGYAAIAGSTEQIDAVIRELRTALLDLREGRPEARRDLTGNHLGGTAPATTPVLISPPRE